MHYVSGNTYVHPNIHPPFIVYNMIWHHLWTYQGFIDAVLWSPLGLKGNQDALRCKVHIVNTLNTSLRLYVS